MSLRQAANHLRSPWDDWLGPARRGL